MVISQLLDALKISGLMAWQILWALILGFFLSSIIQALVKSKTISNLLGKDNIKSIFWATIFGAVSSSCSYAAVALAKTLWRKGASFSAAMAFEIASTNLVIELGIIIALLISWQFTLAEFIGGPLMIIFVAVIFRLFLRKNLLNKAQVQADKGLIGVMEGHAAMDMSIDVEGSLAKRLFSEQGVKSVSDIFVMEWAAVIKDILIGLLVAGALAAWIPLSFWHSLFLSSSPLLANIWGPIIGPLVSLISFVCSVGNIPLAAVLWNGGISFGGVISFIFADLIILPILFIYKKYYGFKMAFFILISFYFAMVISGYLIELLFHLFKIIPRRHQLAIYHLAINWNYTTILNIIFLLLAAWLVYIFIKNGSLPMLRMMNVGKNKMK